MSSLILPPIKPSHYRPDIDGLRAIAIVSVVIFHTFPTQLPGGFVGVDVFFVISGYLISTIIFRSLEKESFSFLDFYARRIRRIFPALAFAWCHITWLSLFNTRGIQKSRKADYLWICIWREHFPYPSFRWLLGYSYRNETFDAFVDFGC